MSKFHVLIVEDDMAPFDFVEAIDLPIILFCGAGASHFTDVNFVRKMQLIDDFMSKGISAELASLFLVNKEINIHKPETDFSNSEYSLEQVASYTKEKDIEGSLFYFSGHGPGPLSPMITKKEKHAMFQCKQEGFLCVPLKSEGKLMGVLKFEPQISKYNKIECMFGNDIAKSTEIRARLSAQEIAYGLLYGNILDPLIYASAADEQEYDELVGLAVSIIMERISESACLVTIDKAETDMTLLAHFLSPNYYYEEGLRLSLTHHRMNLAVKHFQMEDKVENWTYSERPGFCLRCLFQLHPLMYDKNFQKYSYKTLVMLTISGLPFKNIDRFAENTRVVKLFKNRIDHFHELILTDQYILSFLMITFVSCTFVHTNTKFQKYYAQYSKWLIIVYNIICSILLKMNFQGVTNEK